MPDTFAPPPEPQYRRRTWRDLLPRFDADTWPVWVVVVICAAVFAWQSTRQDQGFDFMLVPSRMQGHEISWLTSIFMHAGLLHIGSNMYSYLQIAPLVILRFGGGLKALVPYHIFYILCGLAGNAVFYVLHQDGQIQVLGASGAIYGVAAALLRLDPTRHELYPILSRQTLRSLWFFVFSNAIVIFIFGGTAIFGQILSGQPLQLPIAWEAHLGGYVAGFFLIELMAGKGWPQALTRQER